MKASNTDQAHTLNKVTEVYYDSPEADNFYFNIWGGEDIHIGLYEETQDISQASRATVAHMANAIPTLSADTKLIDLGSGYGGAARYLANQFGCNVVCLNLSDVQNETNRRLNLEQKLDNLVSVVHGSFENIPEPANKFDVVWSQDAILHSNNREQVIAEAWRILKPGGVMIYTDPMQADNCPPDVLQPVLDRIHLDSLGSFSSYKDMADKCRFSDFQKEDMTHNLRIHYSRVLEELERNFASMCTISSRDYIERMMVGLQHWIDAAKADHLAWGTIKLTKP